MGLSLAKVGVGGQRYYLDAVAGGGEDHRGGGNEAEGRWTGAGATALGLSGPVEAGALGALLEGIDPQSGEVLRPARRAIKVAALDLTFSAPKSVSILFALAGPDLSAEVVAGHTEAVGAATGYLEREAMRARRSVSGHRIEVPTTGALGAGFVHRTSRAADPHLHSHVVVANLVQDLDGRWSALDARGVFVLARTAGFLYEAHLRHELSARLGVRWRAVRNGRADLEGIEASVLRAFSRRRQEVEAHLESVGRSGPRAARIAALVTRPARDLDTPFEEISRRWHWRARGLGVSGPSVVERVGARTQGEIPYSGPDIDRATEELLGGALLEAGRSGFTRADLLRAGCQTLRHGSSIADVERLADRVLGSPIVVARPEGPGRWRSPTGRSHPAGVDCRTWTTARILRAETEIVDSARRRRDAWGWALPPEALGAALSAAAGLGAAEIDELRRLLGARAGVDALVGRSSARTAVLLDVARRAWEDSGVEVLGTAARDLAVARLENTTAIESVPLRLVLSGDSDGGSLPERGGVLVLDEAHRVTSSDLERLVRVSEERGAKLVAVGRPLPAGSGGFEVLARTARPLEITGTGPGAVLAGPVGSQGEALRLGIGPGRVVSLSDSLTAAQQTIVRSWVELRARGERAVVVAPDRAQALELRERAAAVVSALSGSSRQRLAAELAEGDGVVTMRGARRVEASTMLVLGDARLLELAGARPSPEADVTYHVVHRRSGEERPLARAVECAPPPYLTAEIGPRPAGRPERQLWRSAAVRIEDFRRRWAIDDRDRALGAEAGRERGSIRGDPRRAQMASLERAEQREVHRALRGVRRQLVPELERHRSLELGRQR